MRRPQLLLVDDSDAFRRTLARALGRHYRVTAVACAAQALGEFAPPPDAVLLDLRLRGDDSDKEESLELLRRLQRELPQVPVIMITAYGDVETAVACMREGAADFIQKGGDVRELRARIEKALGAAWVSSRLHQVEEELAIVEPRELIGASRVMREVREMIAAVSRDGQVSVLITGETGTGKELVARSIHASGPRTHRSFVGVALAALPSTTVESELFGHESGAFTDADRRHIGLIERAHGGVLLLDEIGELSTAVQVKLLRFLEERTITRLGGNREIPMDVQVVAATNADLSLRIGEGRFREDLFYRLKVCEIRLPPLKERREDIPALVEHYLAKLGRSKGISSASGEALEAMTRCDWPGNVRQLRNALESSLLKASLRHHRLVELGDLPEEFGMGAPRPSRRPASAQLRSSDGSQRSLDEILARAELEAVEHALRCVGGRKAEASKLLGLNDRFVFTRRVRRLAERFPGLMSQYPEVQAAFARDFEDQPERATALPIRASRQS